MANRPPYDVTQYVDDGRFWDALRFAAIPAGRDNGHLRFEGNEYTRQGAWIERWAHQSRRVLAFPTNATGLCDMPFARSKVEHDWLLAFDATMPRYLNGHVQYRDYVECGRTNLLTDIDAFNMLTDWREWIADADREYRLRTRYGKQRDNHFVGWHNVEFFSVPGRVRSERYTRVPEWWLDNTECAHVYKTLTPWIYHYYGRYMSAPPSREVQATLDVIAVCQYAELVIPCVLGTAMNGTYRPELNDERVQRPGDNVLTHPVIGPLSDDVSYLLTLWRLPCVLADTRDAVRNLLVFRRIDEIDWNATFAHTQVDAKRRYLPYEFMTGVVRELPETTTAGREAPAVVPVFRTDVERATFESCRLEIEACRRERQSQYSNRTKHSRASRLAEAASAPVPEVLLDPFRLHNYNIPVDLRQCAEAVQHALTANATHRRNAEIQIGRETALNTELGQARAQNLALTQTADQLRGDIARHEQTIKDLRERGSSSTRTPNDLEKELKTLREDLKDAQSSREDAQNAEQRLADEIAKLHREAPQRAEDGKRIRELELEVEEGKQKRNELLDKWNLLLNSKDGEIKTLKGKLKTSAQQLAKDQDEITQLRKTNKTQHDELEQLREALKNTDATLEALRRNTCKEGDRIKTTIKRLYSEMDEERSTRKEWMENRQAAGDRLRFMTSQMLSEFGARMLHDARMLTGALTENFPRVMDGRAVPHVNFDSEEFKEFRKSRPTPANTGEVLPPLTDEDRNRLQRFLNNDFANDAAERRFADEYFQSRKAPSQGWCDI